MNPTNIQEYISTKVIEYLKERDETLKECDKKLKQCLDAYKKLRWKIELDGTPCAECYYFIETNPVYEGIPCCGCGEYVCNECTINGEGEFSYDDNYFCNNCLKEDSSKDSSESN